MYACMRVCLSPIEGAGTLTYDNDVMGDDGRGAGNSGAIILNNVIAAVARSMATKSLHVQILLHARATSWLD